MTEAQRRISFELIKRYPSSAAATGGANLRIRAETAFAELTSEGPDERESFLEAAEKMEKEGLVSLTWKRFREGEELSSIQLINPEGLFSLLKIPFPLNEAQKARQDATLAYSGYDDSRDKERSLFLWLAKNISPEDIPVPPMADVVKLLNAIDHYAKEGILLGITPRALSVKLFSNSKRMETLIEELKPLLRRAGRSGVPLPDFTPVARNYPETLVAGRFRLNLNDGTSIDNAGGHIFGIPLSTAMKINNFDSTKKILLTVENKETFYALSSSPNKIADTFLYTGGHPNRAVQRILEAFARSHFTIHHAGDLDPEGILILQEIAEFSGVRVLPVKMDAQTFTSNRAFTRNLDASGLKRAAYISDSTRALPGIESLLECILTTAQGLEQEIIEY